MSCLYGFEFIGMWMFLNKPLLKKTLKKICEEMNLQQENLIKQAPQDFSGDLVGVFDVLQPND
jgi:hypothetical protein